MRFMSARHETQRYGPAPADSPHRWLGSEIEHASLAALTLPRGDPWTALKVSLDLPMTEPPRDPIGEPRPESDGCWLRLSEAAGQLGVSVSTVRRRIASGALVGRREPYRKSYRWLVQLPTAPEDPASGTPPHGHHASAPRPAEGQRTVGVMRGVERDLRDLASQVEVLNREAVQLIEWQRSRLEHQVCFIEELARSRAQRSISAEVVEAPAEPAAPVEQIEEPESRRGETPAKEGSALALVIAGALFAVAIVLLQLALPAWTGGILVSVAAVCALIAAVELFLVVSDRSGRRSHEQ